MGGYQDCKGLRVGFRVYLPTMILPKKMETSEL